MPDSAAMTVVKYTLHVAGHGQHNSGLICGHSLFLCGIQMWVCEVPRVTDVCVDLAKAVGDCQQHNHMDMFLSNFFALASGP